MQAEMELSATQKDLMSLRGKMAEPDSPTYVEN